MTEASDINRIDLVIHLNCLQNLDKKNNKLYEKTDSDIRGSHYYMLLIGDKEYIHIFNSNYNFYFDNR